MTSLLDLRWIEKKFWRSLSYSLKLFFTFMMVLVVCGGILIMLFGHNQRQTLLEQTYDKGRFISLLLARNLETPLFFMNMEQLSANAEAILGITDIAAILVYDKDGNLIVSRFAPRDGEFQLQPREMNRLAQLMAEHTNVDEETLIRHWRQERYFVFCKRIVTVGQSGDDKTSLYFETGKEQGSPIHLGGVQVIIEQTQYERGMERIVRHAVLIFLLFLPVSLFLALMLARDVVKPLRVMVASLRTRLGTKEGEGEGEGEGNTSDELGQLDNSFRQLISQLEAAFATIAQMNEKLEEKVAIRTAELTTAMQELKEAQAHLMQSEKMGAVGQLVAGVAHEVNNTTNFITGALPPLGKRLAELRRILEGYGEQSCPDSGRVAELMQSIDLLMGNVREGARRTSKIVSDLRNFSRPDDDLSTQVDINQCLESTLALALPEYRHRIEVSREFAADLPKVSGSQGQLNQVFMNLIINAIHAQPDKGSLLIRTFSSEDGVHVLFKDNGPGIPEHIQKKIFDPFFTTKEIGKGTGLGLSVSFGIISKHRGRIVVRSEPGQGAEFEVILPIGQEAIASQQEGGEQ